jgi:hypothetical protein
MNTALHHPDRESLPPRAFELLFPSLLVTRPALSFPCDARGVVEIDALSERARNNYLLARALTGCDYAWPSVRAGAC